MTLLLRVVSNAGLMQSHRSSAGTPPEESLVSTFSTSGDCDHQFQAPAAIRSEIELAALRTKAILSIDACQRTTVDLLKTLATRDDHRPARHPKTPLLLSNATTTAFEAFFASAKNLVAGFSEAGPLAAATRSSADDSRHRDLKARLLQLTARQKSVLRLVVQGLPNKVIAYELGITETTVKAHVGEIIRKLGVYSRVRAIVLLSKLKSEAGLEI